MLVSKMELGPTQNLICSLKRTFFKMHYTTIENNRDIFCKDKIQPTYIFT